MSCLAESTWPLRTATCNGVSRCELAMFTSSRPFSTSTRSTSTWFLHNVSNHPSHSHQRRHSTVWPLFISCHKPMSWRRAVHMSGELNVTLHVTQTGSYCSHFKPRVHCARHTECYHSCTQCNKNDECYALRDGKVSLWVAVLITRRHVRSSVEQQPDHVNTTTRWGRLQCKTQCVCCRPLFTEQPRHCLMPLSSTAHD